MDPLEFSKFIGKSIEESKEQFKSFRHFTEILSLRVSSKFINEDDHSGSYNPMAFDTSRNTGEQVRTLENIVLVSFAVSLMRHKATRIRLLKDCSCDDEADQLSSISEIDLVSVTLPTEIKRNLVTMLQIMNTSVMNWKNYLYRSVFLDREHFDYLPVNAYLENNLIVWQADGSINKRKSIEKILLDEDCGLTSSLEKYWLACMYCVEESVKRLQSISELQLVQDDAECKYNKNNLLLQYWHDVERYNTVRKDGYGLMWKLMTSEYHNSSNVEYMWNHLRTVTRSHKVIAICEAKNPHYLKRALSELNPSEFDYLIKRSPTSRQIFVTFAQNSQFFELVVTIWQYMLRRIDDEAVIAHKFKEIKYEIDPFAKHKKMLMLKLWQCAPAGVKRQIKMDDWNCEDVSGSE